MSDAERVKEKLDIVSFIGEYITLKKSGRNFKANCPFHGESTPSFFVSIERQAWYCFGCGKGGDMFSFFMEYEKVDFSEALRVLAKKTGVNLSGNISGGSSKKELLYKINLSAMQFYNYLLTNHSAGEKALEYLRNREISEKIIKTFNIGYAPKQRTALSEYLLRKKNYSPEDVELAGLTIKKGNILLDFFTDRVIFPLIDHRDNVVGFSGRIIDNNTKAPKYINTRETPIYHKGDHFFGINSAKEDMRAMENVILVEGEFDVISSFKEGVKNVVAIKGTALTENQAVILSRYVKKVKICFDKDNAGQEALKRSIPILEKHGLMISVVDITNGKDIDESIKNDPFVFKKALKEDVPVYDYLIESIFDKYSADSAEDKVKILQEILPFISLIQNQVVLEHYIKKISKMIDSSTDSLYKELEKIRKPAPETKPALYAVKKERRDMLMSYLLALVFQSNKVLDYYNKYIQELVDLFSADDAQEKLIMNLSEYFKSQSIFDSGKFESFLPQEMIGVFNQAILFPIKSDDEKFIEKEVSSVVFELKNVLKRKALKEIARKIDEKERLGEDTESLSEKYKIISKK